jgi:hypothetical protein
VGWVLKKILVTTRWVFITTSGLVMKLELGQKLRLSGHDFR